MPDSTMTRHPQIIYKKQEANLLDRYNELMHDITKK